MTTEGLQGADSPNNGSAALLAALVKAGLAPTRLREATWGGVTRWTEGAAAQRGERVPKRRLHLPAKAHEHLHKFVPESRVAAEPLFEGARWSSHARKATPGPKA
ncbi:hypothetical protein [Streptomyces sp. NPDC000405]|uniref:hypothetical protein n=1 Tax=Streptomyces sp. NPDC000405 TaxID=3161033 RepID=UPI00398C9671